MHPDQLRKLISLSDCFAEVRYHKKKSRTISVRKGEVVEMSLRQLDGVSIRVLRNGTFGFASTSDMTDEGLARALKSAMEMARGLQTRRLHPVTLAQANLARGTFATDGYQTLDQMPVEEKLGIVRKCEEDLRKSSHIQGAQCQYAEIFEEKHIITTDGADCVVQIVRPELRFSAFAEEGGKMTSGFDSVGATGGWKCLFENRSIESYIETAAKSAVDLLGAPVAEGGKHTVILSPAMVGLLSHEAIGHTVEADFVKSGSVAQGKIGHMVASELVTLCDSGLSEFKDHAGGMLPVDDEGVVTGNTTIIDKGRLVSYLHNRQSAAEFGAAPTGNARAWEYSDEPLIRMRNTYVAPGSSELEYMIGEIKEGFYIDGPEGGQADATGEFMFGASRVRKIKNGKLEGMVQKVSVSGNAFEVLSSVDAVSRDFQWDLGSGHCGKGQPAKVDAGGPFIRCKVLIGGEQ